jgi:hypothetical protein
VHPSDEAGARLPIAARERWRLRGFTTKAAPAKAKALFPNAIN